MTTTLTVDMDDRTQRKWDEFITTLGVAEAATGELDDAAKELAAEMKHAEDEANAAERRIEELAIAVKRGSDEFGTMSKSVKLTQDKLDDLNKSTQFLKGGTFIEIGRAIISGLKAADQFIGSMAEKGNKNFESLHESTERLKNSFQKMADTASKTDFGAGVMKIATNQVDRMAEGVEALPELWENLGTVIRETHASAVEGWGEYGRTVREATDYQAQLTAEAQRTRQEAVKADEMAKEYSKGREAAESGLKALADDRRRQESQAFASRIGNEQQLSVEIQKQNELLKSEKITKDEVKAIVEKIVLLEQRRGGIQQEQKKYFDEQAAGWKKYYEDRQKADDDAIKKRQDAEKEAAKKRMEEHESEIKYRIDVYQAGLKQQLEADKKAQKERQDQLQELTKVYSGGMRLDDAKGKSIELERKASEQILQIRQQMTMQYMKGDVQGFMQSRQKQFEIYQQYLQAEKDLRDKFSKEGNIIDKIKGGFTNKDVLGQVEKNRIDKIRKDREADRPDPFENDDVVDPKEARQRARYDRETKRQEQNARRNLRRDMQRGNVGEEEVANATNDLTKATIDAAQSSKKLTETQKGALRAAFDAQKSLAQNQKQTNEELDALRQDFEDLKALTEPDSMGNARKRAAVGSRR